MTIKCVYKQNNKLIWCVLMGPEPRNPGSYATRPVIFRSRYKFTGYSDRYTILHILRQYSCHTRKKTLQSLRYKLGYSKSLSPLNLYCDWKSAGEMGAVCIQGSPRWWYWTYARSGPKRLVVIVSGTHSVMTYRRKITTAMRLLRKLLLLHFLRSWRISRIQF